MEKSVYYVYVAVDTDPSRPLEFKVAEEFDNIRDAMSYADIMRRANKAKKIENVYYCVEERCEEEE